MVEVYSKVTFLTVGSFFLIMFYYAFENVKLTLPRRKSHRFHLFELKHFKRFSVQEFNQTSEIECGMELVESLPPGFECQKSRTCQKSTNKAMLELIRSSKFSFSMMTRYRIQGLGEDFKIVESLKHALQERNISVQIGVIDEQVPFSLANLNRYSSKNLKILKPSIKGKLGPEHGGRIIHSKIYLSDKYDFI